MKTWSPLERFRGWVERHLYGIEQHSDVNGGNEAVEVLGGPRRTSSNSSQRRAKNATAPAPKVSRSTSDAPQAPCSHGHRMPCSIVAVRAGAAGLGWLMALLPSTGAWSRCRPCSTMRCRPPVCFLSCFYWCLVCLQASSGMEARDFFAGGAHPALEANR